MRMWAAQDPAVQRPRGKHVVGVDGAACDLGGAVDPGERLADDPHLILSAASSTACRIFV